MPHENPEVQRLADEITLKLRNAGTDSALGAQAFNEAEQSLPDNLKQEVYKQVAKEGVIRACQGLQNPNTLLRGNSPTTAFMSQYMKTYATEYNEAVAHKALEALDGIQLPQTGRDNAPLNGTNTPSPSDLYGGNAEMQNSEEWARVVEETGKAILDASESQLPKLSPEARDFLSACTEGAREGSPEYGEEASTMVMANTLVLRSGTPFIMNQTVVLGQGSDSDKIKAALLRGGGSGAQTYVNTLGSDNLDTASPAAKVANEIRNRNEGMREGSLQTYQNLTNGQVPNTPQQDLAPDNAGQNLPTNRAQVPPQVVVNQPQVVAEDQAQAPGRRSVRDMMRSAKESIKKAFKVDDESKLKRTEKQIAKRDNHIKDLQARKDDIDKMVSPEAHDLARTKLNPQAFVTGSEKEIKAQQELMDAMERIGPGEMALARQSAKLEGRLKRNQDKKEGLVQKAEHLRAKIELKQNRHNAQNQQVGGGNHHGHN